MRITEHIRRLKGYVHGEQPSGRGVVKLNTNENAYPPSPKCAEALRKFAAASLRLYPNAESTPLRKAIATLHGTSPDNVFVGNGSDEILSLAARVFVGDDEAIGSLDPSYSLYKTLAAIRDVKWVGTPIHSGPQTLTRRLGALWSLAKSPPSRRSSREWSSSTRRMRTSREATRWRLLPRPGTGTS